MNYRYCLPAPYLSRLFTRALDFEEPAPSYTKNAAEDGYPRLQTITKPMIQKTLDRSEIKPFKINYYCEKRDPDFESKMHEILLFY